MLKPRTLSIGMILALLFALVLSVSAASAQEEEDEVTLGGSVKVRDDGNNPSARLIIALRDLPAPPAGMAYEGWLVGRDDKISTGVFYRAIDGSVDAEWTHPDGANIFANYAAFAITTEPVPDPDPATPGEVVYADTIDSGAYFPLLNILVESEDAPDDTALGVGLRDQLGEARNHARAVRNGADLAAQQAAAQSVLDIIMGAGNDGFGAAAYAEAISEQLNLAQVGTTDKAAVEAIKAAIGANDWVRLKLTQAAGGASNLIAATGEEHPEELKSFIQNVYEPLDTINRDANAAYAGAQDMATFVPILGAVPGTPGVGDGLVPTVARGVLLFGVIAMALGMALLLRRRRTVVLQAA